MENLTKALYLNLIKENRYLYIVNGLKNTLTITVGAAFIGLVLGLIIALIRITYDNNKKLKILNFICKLYITVIRGTPAVVQLMILYFCIFTSRNASAVAVAIISFGLNSTAYVAEIFRSGFMSVEKGQMEAGRSLGFNYIETMAYIIVPQAFRVVIPTLCNEFISLIKETAVVGYIAVQDLTKGGDIIRSRTYDAWTPLLIVALIYLTLTVLFTKIVEIFERRAKTNGK